MHSVKRFAESMNVSYEGLGEFHVPPPVERPLPRLFTSGMLRRHTGGGLASPVRNTLNRIAFQGRLWTPLPAQAPRAVRASAVAAAPVKPPHMLGLQLTFAGPVTVLSRHICWFQVGFSEVSSASARCDTALRSATRGLAEHSDDPKSLRAVLKAFREARTAFYVAKDVMVYRDMKDLLQEAWMSAQSRETHREHFELYRAETESLIRDLSDRIDSLHDHVLRQAASLEAADAEIAHLRRALGEARSVDSQSFAPSAPQSAVTSAKLATSSEAIAQSMVDDPNFVVLKDALKAEILESFRQEFLLGTAPSDVPRFASRTKDTMQLPEDALQERFRQMRKLSERRLSAPSRRDDASSLRGWELVSRPL